VSAIRQLSEVRSKRGKRPDVLLSGPGRSSARQQPKGHLPKAVQHQKAGRRKVIGCPADAERLGHDIGNFLCGDVEQPTDNISFFSPHFPLGNRGKDHESQQDAPGIQPGRSRWRRPNARSALDAVRTAVGAELKRLLSNVVSEPIPEEMAELLRQLDQPPPEGGQNSDDS
jgi:hypothetical protein